LTPESILENFLTKGIITKRDVRKSSTLSRALPGFSTSWIVNISASLARSFWELVWRPRTSKVESLHLELKSEKRKKERVKELEIKVKK
jgi:hypothetical protein